MFASHDLHLDNVTILAGESAIKECSNIIAIPSGMCTDSP